MENGTYTYNHEIKGIGHGTLKENLNDIAEFIYKRFGMKINFCEVLGYRRSFYAGIEDLLTAEHCIKVSDRFEMVVEDNRFDDVSLSKLVSDVKEIICNSNLI